jgi:hypothetical protein
MRSASLRIHGPDGGALVRVPFAKHVLVLAAAAAGIAAPARAADAERLKALEQKLEASLRTIEVLQRRVEQLERRDEASVEAPDRGWGVRLETVERTMAQIGSAAAQADPVVPIHGFADVVAGRRNDAAAGLAHRGFTLGVLDLYLTPQIGPQVKALVEIAFEYDDEGGLFVDVERMQLGFVHSDALTLWAGRFHTPYGYWNTAYHHGAQIQTSISRPRFLEFEDEGGIMPSHSVGLWATGGLRMQFGRADYDAYVANADRVVRGVLDFQPIGIDGGHLGSGFRASVKPTGVPATFGVHGMRQRIGGDNADGTATGRVRLNMLGAFAAWESDDWEALAEYYRFRNRDLAGGSGTHHSNAWYVQLGHHVVRRWTAYARHERASLNAADPYFALLESGHSYRRNVAGLRYDLTPKAALKAEWMRWSEDGVASRPSTIAVQYSIRF